MKSRGLLWGIATCAVIASISWISPLHASVVTTVLGTTGAGVTGLVIDSSGNVYTANSSANNVTKITPSGVSSIFASTGAGSDPRAIAIDSSGNIYTANYGNDTVSKFTTSGVPDTSFSGDGIASTGQHPNSIAVDSAGNIYVGSANEIYVSKFNPTGTTRTDISVFTFGIEAIAIDSSNNLYAANFQTDQVLMFNSAGTNLRTSNVGDAPSGIAIDSSGNVYVSNSSSNTVSKIDAAGVVSTLGTTGSSPYGIAVDSTGNVYVSNFISETVTKITPSGVSTVFGSAGSYPYRIALDSAGNVYVTNANGGDTVTKLSVAQPVVVATPLTVTFDTRGGSPIANGTTINGGSVTDPGTPTRDGYAFIGWNTAADGSGTSITFPYHHTNSSDFTLYAQWRANSNTAATPTTTPPATEVMPLTPEELPSTGITMSLLPLLLIAAGVALIGLRQRTHTL